jgi:hypothetical protein
MFFPTTIAVGNTYSAISVDAYNKDRVGDFPDLNAGICTTISRFSLGGCAFASTVWAAVPVRECPGSALWAS